MRPEPLPGKVPLGPARFSRYPSHLILLGLPSRTRAGPVFRYAIEYRTRQTRSLNVHFRQGRSGLEHRQQAFRGEANTTKLKIKSA